VICDGGVRPPFSLRPVSALRFAHMA
jgi:hypothetical protein